MLSRYVLDMQPYNTERIDVTWEDCTLRSWLNDDFINKAFTEREQECINAVTISNPGNEYQKTPGCDPTTDRIFCLSVEDILAHYEFSYYVEHYRYGYSEQLMTEGTRYAKMLGVERLTKYGTLSSYVDGYIEHGFSEECYEINGAWWWLRTLGATGHSPCSVGGDGAAGWGTNVVYNDVEEIGVRPALYIKK